MRSLLGVCGIVDLSGEATHVQIVGETDAGRLLVQRVGCQEPVIVVDRTAFVTELAIAPEPLSDNVRQAALDLGRAIERAKALAGSDRLLEQEDFQILHQELEDADKYPFASALIEHGVHVRTGAVDIMTDPHDEGDSLGLHAEPWASPGGKGEAEGRGQDPQDSPGSYPWTPADAGDGISNEEAHTEFEFPWVRKVEGQAHAEDVLLSQIDKAIEEGGGWASVNRLPGGEAVIWDLIERDILVEDSGFVRRRQPDDPPRKRYDPDTDEMVQEAEMGWSGLELTTSEHWASVSMQDLIDHPKKRPQTDLEKATKRRQKDADLNSPSGRDRALNPSVHEEIGKAYLSNNQFEDPDLHLGGLGKRNKDIVAGYLSGSPMTLVARNHGVVDSLYSGCSMALDRKLQSAQKIARHILGLHGEPYQTNAPLAEGEGEGVFDELDLSETNLQHHAKEEPIGIAGDKFEDEGYGEGIEPQDDAVKELSNFGALARRRPIASVSMMELIAQGVDNRLSDPNIHTDVDEQRGDRAIPRPPEDEDSRYDRAPGPA